MPDERRIKVIVPIAMDAAGVANRAQQLPADLVAPGFRPEFSAVTCGAVLTGHDGGVNSLRNTNFWRIRDGRFHEVYVYMSGANVLT